MSGLNEWKKHDNPLHILSLGAGRQSSAMYLMAIEGVIMPRPHCAIFADTGNEPTWVYEQLEYLKQWRAIIPIHVVTNGNIYTDSMAATSGDAAAWGAGRWVGPPVFSEGGGPIRRKCTQHYKTKPKEDEIRRLLKETGRGHVIDWRGHTTNEIERAKPDKRKYFIVRWPLLELRYSDHDCAMWLHKNGHPEFKWSACEICPFRLREWGKAKHLSENKESWQRIKAIDNRVRNMTAFGLDKPQYLNAAYVSMDEFVNAGPLDPQPSLFDCDGGACGL